MDCSLEVGSRFGIDQYLWNRSWAELGGGGAEDNDGVALSTADVAFIVRINSGSYSFAGFSRIRDPRPLWAQRRCWPRRSTFSVPRFPDVAQFWRHPDRVPWVPSRVDTDGLVILCGIINASLTSLIATSNTSHVCLWAVSPNKCQLGLGRDQRPTRRSSTIRPCRRRGSHPLNGPGSSGERRTVSNLWPRDLQIWILSPSQPSLVSPSARGTSHDPIHPFVCATTKWRSLGACHRPIKR